MTSQEAQASLVDQQLHRMSSHSSELRDLHTRQENADAREEDGTAWQGPRLQKTAAGEKRAAEWQRKKTEKEAEWLMKQEQNKVGVKLSQQLLDVTGPGGGIWAPQPKQPLYGLESIFEYKLTAQF